MMKLKLPFTGNSRGRYAPVSMGMQPVGGVLASPSGMDDDDPHRFDDRFHDAQTPKRFTVLNRPSRTRSWLLVLFCVALIGMGMVIWSGWQPLDWDFKKLRLPGFDTNVPAPAGHPHAPPPPTPHKPVESVGGLDVVAPTGEDTAMDFSTSDGDLSSGKAAHEYGYHPGHDEEDEDEDEVADHEDVMDHVDYEADHHGDDDGHGDADMYGHTTYDSTRPTTSTDHEEVTDLYGDDGSHTSGSHADSDHDALLAGEEEDEEKEHEVTDLYGDDGSHTSGSHEDEHGPLSPAVIPVEDEDEESDETKYHLDHSGLPTTETTDASAYPDHDHDDADPEDDPDLDSAYPTSHTDLDAGAEPSHEIEDDLEDDHFAPSPHTSAPHPGTVGSTSHSYGSLSHSSDLDADTDTEVEGEDRVDPNVDGLREEAKAGGFPEPTPNARSMAKRIGEQAESTFESRVKALFWFA